MSPFDLTKSIRTVNDFPKPGIKFLDVTSILENPEAFKYTVEQLRKICARNEVYTVVAIDARGFVWGGAVANDMRLVLNLARKPGKLPGEVVTKEYALEYGTASLSMLKNAPMQGKNIMIIDDILATGGTLNAVGELLTEHWGIAPENQIHTVIASLDFLPGKDFLKQKGYRVESLVSYQ